MKEKKKILNHLKAYCEDFYLKNAAMNPESVEAIKYFLDWVQKDATVNDLEVIPVDMFVRECNIGVKVHTRYSVGDPVKIQFYVSDNAYFADHYQDTYFSTEANSRVLPGNLAEIAMTESKRLFDAEFADDDTMEFVDATLLDYEVSDPVKTEFYKCLVRYPHPIADKNGSHIRSFDFVEWNDGIVILPSSGPDLVNEKPAAERKKGCYVATSVYGSYDCPEVWTLRRFRDQKLGATWYGRAFIKLYYAISPTLVKLFGKTKWFQNFWKKRLDKMVQKLNSEGYENTPYDDKKWN